MKTISLPHGYATRVDDTDFDAFSQYRWSITHTRGERPYAYRHGKLLHREILQAPKGLDVDHINGDTLDNRRCNLRLATRSQNIAYQRKPRPHTSPYRGVSWDRARNLWLAVIKVNQHFFHLGRFADPAEAARAYDRAAWDCFGAFAAPNFPEPS